MVDYDDPAQVELRKNQEDPIVMYLIVREELGMSVGKTGAQCGHAAQMVLLKYFDIKDKFDYVAAAHGESGMQAQFHKLCDFKAWLEGSFRKVVLRADDKEWLKVKEAFPDLCLVVDAGLTELNPNTETVIGLWPMRKSEVPKVIKKLQVLK
jgi:peptidyl-tRNA hydrolase